MDLIIVVLSVFIFGSLKLHSGGRFRLDSMPVMNKDGFITMPEGSIPVGSNLELKREPEAFTLILRELGLKR